MHIPDKTHPKWLSLVTGETRYDIKFIAAKIMLGSIIHSIKEDPAPENIKSSIDKVYNLFLQNNDNPVAQDDIRTLFGEVEP